MGTLETTRLTAARWSHMIYLTFEPNSLTSSQLVRVPQQCLEHGWKERVLEGLACDFLEDPTATLQQHIVWPSRAAEHCFGEKLHCFRELRSGEVKFAGYVVTEDIVEEGQEGGQEHSIQDHLEESVRKGREGGEQTANQLASLVLHFAGHYGCQVSTLPRKEQAVPPPKQKRRAHVMTYQHSQHWLHNTGKGQELQHQNGKLQSPQGHLCLSNTGKWVFL